MGGAEHMRPEEYFHAPKGKVKASGEGKGKAKTIMLNWKRLKFDPFTPTTFPM